MFASLTTLAQRFISAAMNSPTCGEESGAAGIAPSGEQRADLALNADEAYREG